MSWLKFLSGRYYSFQTPNLKPFCCISSWSNHICFNFVDTVLQPQIFRKLRADLASMWSTSNKGAYPRRISAKASWSSLEENDSAHDDEAFMNDEDITSIKVKAYNIELCCIYMRHIFSVVGWKLALVYYNFATFNNYLPIVKIFSYIMSRNTIFLSENWRKNENFEVQRLFGPSFDRLSTTCFP